MHVPRKGEYKTKLSYSEQWRPRICEIAATPENGVWAAKAAQTKVWKVPT